MASGHQYSSVASDQVDSLHLSDLEDQLEEDLKLLENKSSKRRHPLPPIKEANYRHDQTGECRKITRAVTHSSR